VADTADRDANHTLRARFDEVHGQYQRLRSGLDEIQRRLTDLRVSAESDDGLVRATVGSRGQLTDLRLDPHAYRSLEPAELSRTIVHTVQAATARAAHEVEATMAAHLPADSGPLRFVRDGDFGSLLRRSDQIMREAGDG
jgi:DNA-binding protein YbaB